VRCLPNPFYLPELKQQTGLDAPVRDYVLKWEQTQKLIAKLFDLIDYLLPLYRDEGKTQLTIAIGCTGGKHRSVVFAECFGEHMRENKVRSAVSHRDIKKHKE
ncbi:MAG: RNase adapter RapZ, partial [Pygmaiobacter sp.]